MLLLPDLNFYFPFPPLPMGGLFFSNPNIILDFTLPFIAYQKSLASDFKVITISIGSATRTKPYQGHPWLSLTPLMYPSASLMKQGPEDSPKPQWFNGKLRTMESF